MRIGTEASRIGGAPSSRRHRFGIRFLLYRRQAQVRRVDSFDWRSAAVRHSLRLALLLALLFVASLACASELFEALLESSVRSTGQGYSLPPDLDGDSGRSASLTDPLASKTSIMTDRHNSLCVNTLAEHATLPAGRTRAAEIRSSALADHATAARQAHGTCGPRFAILATVLETGALGRQGEVQSPLGEPEMALAPTRPLASALGSDLLELGLLALRLRDVKRAAAVVLGGVDVGFTGHQDRPYP